MNISLAELAALSCAVFWAVNGLLLRSQADKVPPATMNAARCAVAGGLFWVLLPFEAPSAGLLQTPPADWGLLFASVILGIGIGDTLYLIALKEIGLARAMALSGIFPLTTMLWETLILDHPPSPTLALGSLLVISGVVLLSRPARVAGAPAGGSSVRLNLGILLSLVAALFWGLSSVLLKPAIAHLTLIQANAVRMSTVALFLFLFRILPSKRESLRAFDRRSFLVVASTGVLGMGIGAYFFLYAISHAPVAKVVTLSSSAPFFGMILSVLFLRERLTGRLVVGMLCCMGGVWVVV